MEATDVVIERVERAAGGFVIRGEKGRREVLLIDDIYGRVTFPKGHLEKGETWEAAAIREIAEETGIQANIIGSIGRIEYPVIRDGRPVKKQVRFFLLEAIDDKEPVHQAEEIRKAYYLPLDEAANVHLKQGYPNWSFVFDKANALLAWLDGGYEQTWRQLSADSTADVVDAAFAQALPVVNRLIDACREELRVTMPELTLAPKRDITLPRPELSSDDVRNAIESTVLKPEASAVDIAALCDEAVDERFPLVCINPQHVSFAANRLAGSDTRVCTVIGFPLGATSLDALAFEVMELAAKGAAEIDMVIPVGSMVEDDMRTVYDHVSRVVRTAKALQSRPAIKVILETSALSLEGVIKAALVSIAAGADYIKTSTGFHRGGATLCDVSTMAIIAAEVGRVKASGGVRTPQAARMLMRYGADRLGTSSGAKLVRQ